MEKIMDTTMKGLGAYGFGLFLLPAGFRVWGLGLTCAWQQR